MADIYFWEPRDADVFVFFVDWLNFSVQMNRCAWLRMPTSGFAIFVSILANWTLTQNNTRRPHAQKTAFSPILFKKQKHFQPSFSQASFYSFLLPKLYFHSLVLIDYCLFPFVLISLSFFLCIISFYFTLCCLNLLSNPFSLLPSTLHYSLPSAFVLFLIIFFLLLIIIFILLSSRLLTSYIKVHRVYISYGTLVKWEFLYLISYRKHIFILIVNPHLKTKILLTAISRWNAGFGMLFEVTQCQVWSVSR